MAQTRSRRKNEAKRQTLFQALKDPRLGIVLEFCSLPFRSLNDNVKGAIECR
jgi:hypothetical protein